MNAGIIGYRLLVENYSALHRAQTLIIRILEAGNRIPGRREEQLSLVPVVESDAAGH
jgi:hypothetical protein